MPLPQYRTMETRVSATEARKTFLKHVEGAKSGHSYVITRYGKPVARIEPVDAESQLRFEAKARLLDRLTSQAPMNRPRDWTRDDLYDQD